MAERKNLYVGCGLTFASDEFKAEVEATKAVLAEEWEIMQFLGLTAGTSKDVYEQDIIKNVGNCDAFLGICDEPSTGLGWELGTAVERYGKPTLGVAHSGSKVTRLVLGAPAFNPHFVFRHYENMVEDVPKIVAEEFAVVRNSLTTVRTLE